MLACGMCVRLVIRVFQGLKKLSADTVACSARLLPMVYFVLLAAVAFAPDALGAEGAPGFSPVIWPALAVGIVLGGGLVAAFFLTRRSRGQGTIMEGADGEHFHQIADLAGDWVWEMDEDLRFSYLSGRFFELFPIEADSILGKTRAEYIGTVPEDAGWQAHFRDLEAPRPFRNFTYPLPDLEGGARHIRISGRPVFDSQGGFRGYQGTGSDLTAVIEATSQAAHAEATLMDAIESIDTGLVLFDADDRLILCNDRYRNSHPVAKQVAVPGALFEDIVRSIMAAGVYDASMGEGEEWVKKRMDLHRNAPSSHEQKLTNGRWREIHEYPTHDGGTLVLHEDITERKKAEQALSESEARFRNLIEGSVQGLMVHADFKPLFANQAYADIFGFESPDEVIKQGNALDHAAPHERDRLKAFNHARVRGQDAPLTYVFEGIRTDGTRLWLENRGRAVTWKGQTCIQRTIVDVTERFQAEENMRRAVEDADIANRAKSEFLANMSHELRTPLNSVIGFSEILKNRMLGPPDNPKYQEYAADIYSSGKHLLNVISDILDISKIEVGELDVAEEPINPDTLIEACVRMVSERAERAGVALKIDGDGGCPDFLGDERRLKQVLLNLLSNAVKFTPPEGRVSIDAGVINGGGIRFRVRDTGIGIAAEDIPKVLKPFGQVAQSFSRSHEGTGLGLSLAKSLSELQGGVLEIASEPDQGTTVSVTFPAEKILAAQPGGTA